MLTEYTNLDCYAEARLKAEITLAQRRITRLQQEIANKESESQQFVSPYFLEHFDDEIRHRLVQVAKLQGKVGAAQHELACIADKARIDAARRLSSVLTYGAVPAHSASSETARTTHISQLSLFEPGPAPASWGQAADRVSSIEEGDASAFSEAVLQPTTDTEVVNTPAKPSALAHPSAPATEVAKDVSLSMQVVHSALFPALQSEAVPKTAPSMTEGEQGEAGGPFATEAARESDWRSCALAAQQSETDTETRRGEDEVKGGSISAAGATSGASVSLDEDVAQRSI